MDPLDDIIFHKLAQLEVLLQKIELRLERIELQLQLKNS